ncbi:MAG TPA: PASTA domain-containing protein, partial [Chloroflexia bacterium]|nr:PASTA domain-containing protein [Chloroflexia bacterium]
QPTSSFSEVAAAVGPVVPFLPVDVLPAPDPGPVAVAAATNMPTQAGDETSTWVPVGRPATAPSSSAAFAPYRPPAPAAIPPASRSVVMPRWALPVLAGIVLLGLLALVASSLAREGSPVAAARPPVATQPPTAAPAGEVHAAPDLLGATLDQARSAASSGGWTLVEAPGVTNASVTAGLIVDQQPPGGTPLAPGSPLTVTASLGPPVAPAPAPTLPSGDVAPPAPAPAENTAPAPAPPAPAPAPAKEKGNDKGNGKDKGRKP